MNKTARPFGDWPSAISADNVAGAALRFGLVRSGADGSIYWAEGRPAEKGRCVLMRHTLEGKTEELLPSPFSARSRVHEYGGGEFTVADKALYFVNNHDQDIYALTPGSDPRRLTAEPKLRFADIVDDKSRNRLIVVAETEADDSGQHPMNFLAIVDLAAPPGANVSALVEGHDFFASPALAGSGESLAWLAWDLPDMPWDSAALYCASFGDDGAPSNVVHIAGGQNSAVFQPSWSADENLYFIWDETGWGTLHRWSAEEITALDDAPIDCSRPQWAFGMRSYAHGERGIGLSAFVSGKAAFEEPGAHPWDKKTTTADKHPPIDWHAARELRSFESITAAGDGFAGIATKDVMAPAVVTLTHETMRVIQDSTPADLDPRTLSAAVQIQFSNRDGEAVFCQYYPPKNDKFKSPSGQQPPVIFTIHGGPTGMSDRGLKLKTQYWTSRGFGVCDTDYSGSSGYGRAYMRRLDGLWGILDVSDIADAAQNLVDKGLADPEYLFLSGGSAGGMTVLLALADHDIFAGGACAYGVTDLAHLLAFTHKFEAGYLYRLLGIKPGDDQSPILQQRSPVTKAARITKPVIFFQGLDDKVVPPEQSRRMVERLKDNGCDVEYYEFEGEAHGFRQAQTIRTVLHKEHAFYRRLMGLSS